ncbi:GGDEF domain-containing phosphodiesterase [Vibrio sp. 99-8-1]|uniref:GGDEF domain-containing phosphodiesterase n=1 Tax=Vibrio sp. 99-8-1 TaxID=2607602 RepID=UPI001493853A|nr:GGDEF domain-containing phosphodiesterase [Vibrio sp. 99-8-1]NOI68615.1 EAL domain-containing protein [Vibrio sp. 99-8-1]
MTKHSPSEALVQRLFGVFDASNEGLWFMSVDGEVTFYNPTFYKQFDLDIENATLDDWLQLVHPLDRKKMDNAVKQHFEYEERVTSQYRIKTETGRYIWIQGTGVVKSDNGREYMVGSHKDISDQKLMEEYLYQAAYFDNFTGLYNRKKLIVDIDETNCTNKTILYISIADIKSYINQYGDSILDDVANHVIGSFNAFSNYDCHFYRVGTDEFAVLLNEELTDQEIALLCSNCIEKYHQLSEEDGLLYGDEMSLGVYRFVPSEMPAQRVLRWASRTCEYAKARLDQRWIICDDSVESKVERYFYIERELKQAIAAKALSVKYQPIVSVSQQKVLSFEALVRWNSDELGEIYPDEFIPIAEKKGLIFDLGCVVLEKACQFINAYNQSHSEPIRVNVNVSVLQLLNSNFIQSVESIIAKFNVPKSWVVLELTETVLLDGVVRAKSQLQELRQLGYNIALDDFGAGYSSLNSFFNLPLDQIKIDRTMTLSAMDANEPLDYLKFLLKMCSDNSVSVVVEGIETEEMIVRLVEAGMDNLQGYWFSRPLTEHDALNLDIDWQKMRFAIMRLSE